MTKTSKNERKYGANVDKKPPRKNNRNRDIQDKPEVEMYKVLIDNSAFSKVMSYDDCIKLVDKMEAKAKRFRHPMPSLIIVKQQ